MPRNIFKPRRLMTPNLGAKSIAPTSERRAAKSTRNRVVSSDLASMVFRKVEGKAGSVEGDFRDQSRSLCSLKVAFPSPQSFPDLSNS